MTWERIQRGGALEVKPVEGSADAVNIKFTTAPTGQRDEWVAYFETKAVELGMHVQFYSWGVDGDNGVIRAPADTFEEHVAYLDQALDFANDSYERHDLPKVLAIEQHQQQERQDAGRKQAELDERAEKLRRPRPER